MGEVLLLLVVALTVAAVVFGVTVLVSGRDPGLAPAEPDGRAAPLPSSRPLHESDVAEVRFDTALRGYRMAQVDQAMRRAAYDIGYKSELIGVLEAEVLALREGRTADADALRHAREAAAGGPVTAAAAAPADAVSPAADTPALASTAEAGVAEAPAAAAVEDEAALPTTDARATAGGQVVPAAAPVDQPAADVSLRAPADPTAAPATDPTAGVHVASPGTDEAGQDGNDRDRGPAVRSESA
ncbi:DivIVA domain-containing protein [Micromonospora inositola]|uniref:DivIVA domain-containing protein n=1 Tax=Micromonospora inositola TaxID=47865 RepID=A0A1C5HE34_9ACTN|nr:DivIVA domain-containing protein [Micromonospora inositola]SCG44244.1 DivIVA domain-containing protein [Micromonospora inositola]